MADEWKNSRAEAEMQKADRERVAKLNENKEKKEVLSFYEVKIIGNGEQKQEDVDTINQELVKLKNRVHEMTGLELKIEKYVEE